MHLKPHQIQTIDSTLEPITTVIQDLIQNGKLTITQEGLDQLLTSIHDPYHEDSLSLLDVEYQKGYKEGYNAQDWNPQSDYDDGYNKGYNDAEREAEADIKRAYQDGYEKGTAEIGTNYYNGYNDASKKRIPEPIATILEKAGFNQIRATTYEHNNFTIDFTQNFHHYTLRDKMDIVSTRQSQNYQDIEKYLKDDLFTLSFNVRFGSDIPF